MKMHSGACIYHDKGFFFNSFQCFSIDKDLHTARRSSGSITAYPMDCMHYSGYISLDSDLLGSIYHNGYPLDTI